jgi:hypothetical protein
MSRLIILLFTLHGSLFTIYAQDVSFFKENITMKIENGYFYVNGTYYLRPGGDTSIVLAYPFPPDSVYGKVDSVFIMDMESGQVIEPLDRRENSLVFRAGFGISDEVAILISYRQEIRANKAEYILKSTAAWRKPLEEATYQLIVPDSLRIVSFAYPPDDSIDTGQEKVYFWTKRNFMPLINMIFEFE